MSLYLQFWISFYYIKDFSIYSEFLTSRFLCALTSPCISNVDYLYPAPYFL